MSVKPKPGEMWEKTLLDSDGKRFVCSEACCFYEKDKKLYLAWLGGTMMGVAEVGEGMIDREDGWRRVYSPPSVACSEDFPMDGPYSPKVLRKF